MTKKRVYVSSTYMDLVEHRAAVKATLERAQFDVECMEKYPAFDERPQDKCLEDVAQCDYYVLILALRYGFSPQGTTRKSCPSPKLEYEEAVRKGKPYPMAAPAALGFAVIGVNRRGSDLAGRCRREDAVRDRFEIPRDFSIVAVGITIHPTSVLRRVHSR